MNAVHRLTVLMRKIVWSRERGREKKVEGSHICTSYVLMHLPDYVFVLLFPLVQHRLVTVVKETELPQHGVPQGMIRPLHSCDLRGYAPGNLGLVRGQVPT